MLSQSSLIAQTREHVADDELFAVAMVLGVGCLLSVAYGDFC